MGQETGTETDNLAAELLRLIDGEAGAIGVDIDGRDVLLDADRMPVRLFWPEERVAALPSLIAAAK